MSPWKRDRLKSGPDDRLRSPEDIGAEEYWGGSHLEGESGRRSARQSLTAMGYEEAISFSFVNAADDRAVGDLVNTASLTSSNPIDDTQNHMRTTLLGGLPEAWRGTSITVRAACASLRSVSVLSRAMVIAQLRLNVWAWWARG
jgi:hypothetical protein